MSNQNENLPDSQPRLDLPNRNAEYSKSDFGAFEFPDIDGYVIESKLGEGAHGRVFKAIDMSLRKPARLAIANERECKGVRLHASTGPCQSERKTRN